MYKYPRTYHLKWSQNITSDDKILKNSTVFNGIKVVVSEKMDGENTTLSNEYCHARSVDSRFHFSQSWIRSFHGKIAYKIPKNIRICGENLYAKHSIFYNNLQSYFLGFSVWEKDYCLDWDTSVEIFNSLNIKYVPILYIGIYNENLIKSLYKDNDNIEGYVVRIVSGFKHDFNKNFFHYIAKFVRKKHCQTNSNWKYQKIIKNGLAN